MRRMIFLALGCVVPHLFVAFAIGVQKRKQRLLCVYRKSFSFLFKEAIFCLLEEEFVKKRGSQRKGGI
ncbi:hypothetical protein Q648_00880 [Bartonella quintana JK 12]|nr:hypothetical protein Q651_00893 [Bartonella quintana BQ2-D70]ETS17478.1 hypothetical protein Q648_00880 [Bartonella quintana JK 12]ETS19536.1 hypothetical protein Q647_00023 [Bartonella quintana JK 7]KEC58135.1 hypothetical protein O93_01214 [Bartonella quintana JK 19]KEC61029.1 hypothetical protein O91_00868 [Bartonella quintana JK 31]SQF96485.1 Uncharacterised protein [Bartonella quintana]